MQSLNKVMLIGNLTRDPMPRALASGAQLSEFGIACNRRYRSQQGEDREDTCFVDCEAWGNVADLANRTLTKGACVYVEGRLRMDSWQDKNTGQNRTRLKVVVETLQPIDRNAQMVPMGFNPQGGYPQAPMGGYPQQGYQQQPMGGYPQQGYQQPMGGYPQQQQQGYAPQGYQQLMGGYPPQQQGFAQPGYQQAQPMGGYPQQGYAQQQAPRGGYAQPQPGYQQAPQPQAAPAAAVSPAFQKPAAQEDDLVYESVPAPKREQTPAAPQATQPPVANPEAQEVVDDTPF